MDLPRYWTCKLCDRTTEFERNICVHCQAPRNVEKKKKSVNNLEAKNNGDLYMHYPNYPQAAWNYFIYQMKEMKGARYHKFTEACQKAGPDWNGFDIFLEFQWKKQADLVEYDYPAVIDLWKTRNTQHEFVRHYSSRGPSFSHHRHRMNLESRQNFLCLGLDLWMIMVNYACPRVIGMVEKHAQSPILNLKFEKWSNSWVDISLAIISIMRQKKTQKLYMSENLLNNSAFDFIIGAFILQKTRVILLNLDFTGLDIDSIIILGHLLKEEDCGLQTLSLKGNAIEDKGAKALAKGLKGNTTLTILNVQNNTKIGIDGVNSLSEAVMKSKLKVFGNIKVAELKRHNKSCQNQVHKGSDFGNSEAAVLALLIQENSSITSLYITNCQLNLNSAEKLGIAVFKSKSIKNFGEIPVSKLKSNVDENFSEITISGGCCADMKAIFLAHVLKVNTTITSVNILEKTHISPSIMKILALALVQNSKIQYFCKFGISVLKSARSELNLSNLKLGDNEIVIVAEFMKSNTNITNLSLNGNEIGSKGALALGDVLSVNSTLTSLNLNNNLIGDDGMKHFVSGLKK